MITQRLELVAVRNGEIVKGSVIWHRFAQGSTGWSWGIALIAPAEGTSGSPEWGAVCRCPQGEMHLIPDDNTDLTDLMRSVAPEWFSIRHEGYLGLADLEEWVRELTVNNPDFQPLFDWIQNKMASLYYSCC
jgi:hypothetical protein